MDKKIAGLLGAVAGLATAGSAQAYTATPDGSEVLQAASYADLLAPIANPVEALQADNAALAQKAAAEASQKTEEAQYYYPYYNTYPAQPYYYYHHHHHHHHSNYYYHHHHHHHGTYFGVPGVGGVIVR
jgi:hypothetical protein